MRSIIRAGETRAVRAVLLVVQLALIALAIAVAAWGVMAAWQFGWRDLYSDAWRIYIAYLTTPFPQNVLALENGHRPIVPALLRVAELAAFGGDQRPQWAVGLGLAVVSLLAAWRMVLADDEASVTGRAGSLLALSLAIFWLANARMLMHPTESVQTYLVMLMLVAATALAWRIASTPAPAPRAVITCAAAAMVATFSFGTGIVVFPALIVALGAARSSRRSIGALVAAMLVTLALYFALPGGSGVTGSLAFEPWKTAQVIGQWLASPIATLAAPAPAANAFNPDLAPRLAERGAVPTASAAIGWLAIVLLVYATWRARRWRQPTGTQFLGLALAWFSVGVACLLGVSRLDYFQQHPGQILAGRYLPWACLVWCGLALMAFGERARDRSSLAQPLRVSIAAALVLVATWSALDQNDGFAWWSRYVQMQARHQSMAVLAGVYSSRMPQGENVPDDVRAAAPLLKERRAAMFSHPAAGRLGTRVDDAPADLYPVTTTAVAKGYVADSGTPAVDFETALPAGFSQRSTQLWLITDRDRTVVGFAHPAPLQANDRIAGVARGDVEPLHELIAFPWNRRDARPGRGVRVVLQ